MNNTKRGESKSTERKLWNEKGIVVAARQQHALTTVVRIRSFSKSSCSPFHWLLPQYFVYESL
eukprot:5875152-Amphidinium_carterae.1